MREIGLSAKHSSMMICFLEQVSGDLLRDWSILLMGSPLAAAAGNGEEAALAYVFKAREAVEAPSEFEQRALMRSCTDIHEVTHLELLNYVLHNPTRQACFSMMVAFTQ
jgi:hypothetical protein